jgi:pimeloyl-ACP methyl ester carboxylesterase
MTHPETMRSSVVRVHDVRGLAYRVRAWGDPAHPRLILLHGWMDVSASFQFLVDSLERDWHVVAPDWRGFGESAWAPGGYWFPDYYADLDALLELYEPHAPARIVGHSMGGNVAVTYAGLRPLRVARLVTLEGIGLPRTVPEKAPERLLKWLDQLRDPPQFTTYASFEELAARLRRMNPRLTAERAGFLARHWGEEKPDGTVHLRSDPRHKAVNPHLFRIEESLACWRRVTAPVLLVTGRDSHIVQWLRDDPEELAQRKAAFRHLREVELADCGHMMHHDRPLALARVIETFMAEGDGPRREQVGPATGQRRGAA